MITSVLRKSLIFWTFFIGLGAVMGMTMMFIDPTGKMWGMDTVLTSLQVMPWPDIFFTNFIFSGIVLFCVNGATQLFSAFMLLRKNHYAWLCCLICGIILMLWCILEWIIWGFNFMSNLYFAFGLVETICALLYQNSNTRVS